jgi:hypothetical protein
MADTPDLLVLRRHRDLEGFARGAIWWRRGVLAALGLLGLLALLNVFGQRPTTQVANGSAASFSLYAPTHLRGGLLFSARFTIKAHRDLAKATLVLDPGWVEDMAVNTIEPSPVNEGSRNGKLVLELGHIAAGSTYVLWMQFQVNPTNVGRRSQSVELDDGSSRLFTMHRKVTVFP